MRAPRRLRRGPRLLVVALALAAFATAPSAAAAQRPDDLPRLLDTLQALWQQGDAGGLVALGAGQGLELDIQGITTGTVRGRRAAAALRYLFNAQETVAVRPGALSLVAGTDNRAFAELNWEFRPAGAMISERTTVFIAFTREPAGWRVSQIRILP